MAHQPRPDDHARAPSLTGLTATVFRALIPIAEREEVLADLATEHAERAARQGRLAAGAWLWRQLLGSLPALARRSWWRGWTGFEPRASRLHSGGFVMESWTIDLRYSARRLASRPTYALLTVLTLALGAGGTAAIFSIVRALLLEPLPVAREEQVGVLWMGGSWTEEEFLHFRPTFPGFERMASYMPGDMTLEQNDESMQLVRGINTSAELFDVLGVRPFIGRTFQRGDDAQNAAPVTVLSYDLWQKLGGDPAILGRQLRLGGLPRTVIGVMPRGFWFPGPMIRLWSAARLNPENRNGSYTLVGRVAKGAQIEQMQGPLGALAAELGRRFEYPEGWDKTRAPAITPVREFIVGDARAGLLATLAAMGLILLIACVNVAALMLGQVSDRSTELAVRDALGAGRQRLVQQLFLESLLIGILAGAAGAALAAGGFSVLLQSLPLACPSCGPMGGTLAETATLDWTLFAAAMVVALLAASFVAVVPGVALWRGDLRGVMATVRTGGISGRGGRLEGGLVVAQIALAVLLAAGAGLLLRSSANLRSINPGIRVDNVAVIDARMPGQLSRERRLRAVLDVLPALQALPNVRAVAAAEWMPLRGSANNLGMMVRGKPQFGTTVTAFRIVSGDYFEAMGIALRRGRGFVPTDALSTERVVVINEALAAKYFPGEDPIDRIIEMVDEWRIVGVVANVAEQELTDPPVPTRYMLYGQIQPSLPIASFVLSGASAQDVPRLLEAGRQTIQREGRQLAIVRTLAMSSVFDDAVGAPGQLATLLSLLAGLALLLGAVGVYGMISHFVTRRTRDYGIWLALGVPPGRVASQVLGRGLRLVGLGSIVGIIAALAMTRLLSSLLYGVQATDPLALAGAVLTLLAAGALAAFIPARRASRTDPVAVLRQQ